MHAVCSMPRPRLQSAFAAGRRLDRDTVERCPTSRCEVSRLLGTLILYRYAVVLLAVLERSVVTNLERLHVVSSDVE